MLLLLSFAEGAYAQDESPQFEMPCRQVLKLGLEKFMEAYGEKTQDYSTVGQKQGFEYYVNCKRPANDALAAKTLSAAKRTQVDAAREAFNKFGIALWGLKYLEEGGGTMWGLISVGAYAGREDFMETLIKSLAAPERKAPRARQRANASLARIQRWLSARDREPFTEGSEPDQIAESRRQYQETMKDTRDALSQLQNIIRALPDAVAERLAAEMEKETRNALVDTQ